MINDLILRVKYNGVISDLDVDGDVPLRLDISTVDNQEIGTVFGISSQNFNLPGTAKNNKFFNHAYLESAVDVPGLYNTIECDVIRNGETLLQGTLQLNEVVTSEDGFITYDVSVSNRVVEFNEVLKDKFFYEANFSEFDHILSTDNVFSSWQPRSSNTFVSGAVFYPLADYGFDDRLSFPSIPRLSADLATTGSSANTNYPLTLAQFLPAIGVREVFDKIFEQAGYAYTSSLIQSTAFDDLFVLFKNQDQLGVVTSQTTDTSNLFSASIDSSFDFPPVNIGQDDEYFLPYSGSVYDPGSNYNTSTFYYTAPKSGFYNLDTQLIFYNSAQSATSATQYALELTVDRIDPASIPDDYYSVDFVQLQQGTQKEILQGETPGLFLNQGDRVAAVIIIDNGLSDTITTATTIETGSYFKVTSAPLTYEDLPVSMSQQIDSEIKTIDLFKGLLTQFNLIAYAEQDQAKVIRLETFDTWMRSGVAKDWTNKFNSAKRIAIKNPVVEQPRELKFMNAEDDDRISKLAQEQTPNFQYGTLRTLSNSNLTSAESTVESLFSPTVLAPVVTSVTDFNGAVSLQFNNEGASRFIVPHFYKFKNNDQESFKFKPKIGYRTYYETGNNRQSDLYAPTSQYILSSSTSVSFVDYSTLSNYEHYPVTSSTQDLLFNSTYNKLSQNTSLYPSNGTSTFTTYWKNYIDSIYWQDGRKVTLDLFFEEYEYQDIKLNDRIIINNNVYRINKISGFNLTRRDVVTVELLKMYPAYYPVVAPGQQACPTMAAYGPFNLDSGSFTMSGSVVDQGDPVVERGFVLSDSDSSPEIGESGVTKYPTGSGLGLFDYTVDSLTPNTTYYYRSYGSSSECLEYSDVITLTTTTGSITCPTVNTYTPALNVTSASFMMSGSVTDTGSAAVVERGFVVSKTDTTPTIPEGAEKYPTGSGLGQFTYTYTNATGSTNYYFRAYASSSDCTQYGSTVIVQTSASAPPTTGSFEYFRTDSDPPLCTQLTSENIYFEYDPPNNGDIAYTDSGLSTIFVGGGNGYGISDSIGVPSFTVDISNLGVLSNKTTCP